MLQEYKTQKGDRTAEKAGDPLRNERLFQRQNKRQAIARLPLVKIV